MKADIIKKIRAHKKLENVIVLTHNIDAIFLESILLPVLRQVGNPALSVFADAHCAFSMFASQSSFLNGLGRRYRLIPVAMPYPFRFHPKAILLCGRDQATLLVGSGNMGFGGWRENGEVWVEFKISSRYLEEAHVFAYFRSYVAQILELILDRETVEVDIEDAFGTDRKEWVQCLNEEEEGGLIGKVNRGESLLSRLDDYIGTDRVKNLWICAPYFDKKAETIGELREKFTANKVTVLVQEGRTNLTWKAAQRQSDKVEFKSVSYTSSADHSSRFLHAKFYGLERANSVDVILGSANCSKAAWSIPENRGNAELVAIVEMSKGDFQKDILDAIKISDELPELEDISVYEEESDVEDAIASLTVLSARLSRVDSSIRVAFKYPEDIEIDECLLNGESIDFELLSTELLSAKFAIQSKPQKLYLQLKGTAFKKEIESNLIWIDDEFELSASSKERLLVDSIHRNVRDDSWGIVAFNDVLRILQDHLDYIAVDRRSARSPRSPQQSSDSNIPITRGDVFADDFGLLSNVPITTDAHSQGQVRGLQGILLRYFGFGWIKEEEAEEVSPDAENDEEEAHGDELEAKRQLKIAYAKRFALENSKKISKKDKNKASELLKEIIARFSNEEYLGRRTPELIAKDMAIISILMTTAVAHNWLSKDEYFNLTHTAWKAAFFKKINHNTDNDIVYSGYFDKLYRESDHPDAFIRALSSIDLAAALAVWALVSQKQNQTSQDAQLILIQASTVARFPWLWGIDTAGELGDHIHRLMVHTGLLKSNHEKAWENYVDKWVELIRVGQALGKYQEAFCNVSPQKIKDRIKWTVINRGDLLWQGTFGLCVALEDCENNSMRTVKILSLQSSKAHKSLRSDYIIPIKDLAKMREGAQEKMIPRKAKKILSQFVESSTKLLVENVD